jgi:hypothetical protein
VTTTSAKAPRARKRPARRKRRGPLAYFLKKRNPLAYVGQAAALVGLIGGIVGLVFVFKPGWKPQPAPDVGTLKITDSSIMQPVTFRRYLERVRLPAGDLTKAFLDRRGLLIEFDYQAAGFRGKRLPIQWELVDAKTNERVIVDDPAGDDAGGNDAVGITPSTNNEAAKWFVWVPRPEAGRAYYVTVTIYQPRKGDVDVPLADFECRSSAVPRRTSSCA